MISFSTFKSAAISAGLRILKGTGVGGTVQTANECMAFGEDSSPLPGMLAVYVRTSNIAEPVIIGYVNKNQLAAAGEKRLYSLTAEGELSFYAWLKNDGTLELGGNEHNLVRYTPLNSGLNAQDTAINTELGKIAAAITGLGGTYVPGTVSTDISESKIDEIKCI